jgi:hypothetical protein
MSDSVDVLDRLCRDFSSLLPEAVIEEVVAECQHELSGVPRPALPEMLERLARYRLDLVDSPGPCMS